jgi:hypothetical protein
LCQCSAAPKAEHFKTGLLQSPDPWSRPMLFSWIYLALTVDRPFYGLSDGIH